MSYIKQTWVDYPDESTPITAERLNHMENGIEEANNNPSNLVSGDTLPIGSITGYGGENIPTNWLKCDGTQYLISDYPELYEAIGNTYNLETDTGELHFRVPNMVERFLLGAGGDGEFGLGNTGGEKEVKLDLENYAFSVWNCNANYENNDLSGTGTFASGQSGYGLNYTSNKNTPHNNMPPYVTGNYIIKAKQSVGLIGNVVNDINATGDNDVANAKTVKEYVDNKNNYSTEEFIVGTWIDGKPIYRKVIQSGQISLSSTLLEIPTGIENIENIISLDFYYKYVSGTNYIWYKNWHLKELGLVSSGKVGIALSDENATFADSIIIIEYTTTTN